MVLSLPPPLYLSLSLSPITPGYTPNERFRFSETLVAGNLVDTYRHFHPVSADSLSEDIQTHRFSEESPGKEGEG